MHIVPLFIIRVCVYWNAISKELQGSQAHSTLSPAKLKTTCSLRVIKQSSPFEMTSQSKFPPKNKAGLASGRWQPRSSHFSPTSKGKLSSLPLACDPPDFLVADFEKRERESNTKTKRDHPHLLKGSGSLLLKQTLASGILRNGNEENLEENHPLCYGRPLNSFAKQSLRIFSKDHHNPSFLSPAHYQGPRLIRRRTRDWERRISGVGSPCYESTMPITVRLST
ncbi:hypothetical protein BDDG_11611 [Blastomyces dermatitidis ATCC 18188]|uniref:Uncharacterized protein n=1 Tax=Ajellomyces dermatitidis (strain ATCC 18188 / CBS 674.68) TaxID=653446 RepID=A0A0J9HC84_AJEDA|nr:hypothetical protein BDDG_11611 [Blastomyces dermatitidis ATCC 18188]